MTIKQYQEISLIPTGSTYEYELAKYFNIDTSQHIDKVVDEITKEINTEPYEIKNTIKFNNKEWMIEKEILDSTFDQWIRLELILAEQDNVKNLHKLVAIYLRPILRKGMLRKKVIEPFNIDKQDEYATELLNLPVEIAQALIVFFYLSVPISMNNTKIAYLNALNQEINLITK